MKDLLSCFESFTSFEGLNFGLWPNSGFLEELLILVFSLVFSLLNEFLILFLSKY